MRNAACLVFSLVFFVLRRNSADLGHVTRVASENLFFLLQEEQERCRLA